MTKQVTTKYNVESSASVNSKEKKQQKIELAKSPQKKNLERNRFYCTTTQLNRIQRSKHRMVRANVQVNIKVKKKRLVENNTDKRVDSETLLKKIRLHMTRK